MIELEEKASSVCAGGSVIDRRAVVVVALVTSLLALPFLLSPYFIAQDLPAHIETGAQILALWRGDDVTEGRWFLHALPWPNSLPTLALAALIPVVGGMAAAKVLTVVGVVAWPTSLAVLAGRLGRSPWLALLAIPTCFDLSFGYGFLHFVLGKPVFALTIAATIGLARRPSALRFVVVVVAVIVMFHVHLLLFAASVPLAVLSAMLASTSARAAGVGVSAIVLGSSPGLWWWFGRPVISGSSTYLQPWKRAVGLWADLGDVAPGALDTVPWVVSAIGFVVVFVVFVVGTRARAPADRRLHLITGLLVAACAGFTLFGPIRTAEASVVAERFAGITAGLVPLLLPVVVGLRLRAFLVVVGLAAAGIMVVDTTVRWRAFSETQMGDFDSILAAVPDDALVATHFTRPLSSHGHHNALWHWPKLVSLRGGATDDSFALRATCVVGAKPGGLPGAARLTASSLRRHDFLLVQGTTGVVERALLALPVTLVTSTGEWRLFRVEREPTSKSH